MGVLVLNDWTFTPKAADADSPHMVAVADADYVHFGYWTKSSTDRDGDPTAEIASIFGGTVASQITTANEVDGVRGLARQRELYRRGNGHVCEEGSQRRLG